MAGLVDPTMHLCHYTTAEAAFTHILPKGTLRMSAYRNMRDPFENKRPRLRSGTAYGSDDRDEFIHRFDEMEQEVGKARDAYCLLSLTRGDDSLVGTADARFGCPWARARMWEQYADTHAGVCLIFDRQRLVDAMVEALGERGSMWHQPVKYTPSGFIGSHAAIMSLDTRGETTAEYVRDHVARHHDEFFFLKTDDWATEFEYRFVWRRPDDDLLLRAIPPSRLVRYGDALRYVVLGERFPDWQVQSAAAVTGDSGAELRVMSWDRGPYPVQAATPRSRVGVS
jgi:hypothetical protein